MIKLHVINAHEYDGMLTLDNNFIPNVSGGKCQSEKITILLSEKGIQDLAQNNERTFDYDYYNDLLENTEEDKANEYMANNHKDIILDNYNHFKLDEDEYKYTADGIVEFLHDELMENIRVEYNKIYFTNLNNDYVILL